MIGRFLVSFWYAGRDVPQWVARGVSPGTQLDIFADSGAFSAHTSGQAIDVGAYADWLHQNAGTFTAYANLDVKGNIAASLANQRYLEDRGLKPIPVFHGGEPFSVLRDMAATYPYIALGGIAGNRSLKSQTVNRFVSRCFEIAGPAALHGFGMTSWQMLKRFPWYSADSTSWLGGPKYGRGMLFDHRRGDLIWFRPKHPRSRAEVSHVFRDYGLDWRSFTPKPERHDLLVTALRSYRNAEKWLRDRRPIPGPSGEAGPKLYAAVVHPDEVALVAEAANYDYELA